MSLTSACLTICKDGSVVAFQDIRDDWRRTFQIDLILFCLVSVSHIKSELLGCLFLEWPLYQDLTTLVIDIDDFLMASRSLFIVHRSASNGDFDCFVFFGKDCSGICCSLISLASSLNHIC